MMITSTKIITEKRKAETEDVNSDSLSDSDGYTTPPPNVSKEKFKKSKHRKQRFRSEWNKIKEFSGWLIPDPNCEYKAKCIYCNYSMNSDITVIKRHGKCVKHQNKVKIATIGQHSTVKYSKKQCNSNKAVASAELKIVGFLVEHNLSFRLVDNLVELVKEMCENSEIGKLIKLKRTKATKVAVNVIGACHKQEMTQKLKQTKFSILCDESTDISTIKTSCVVVRFYDSDVKKVVSKFWELDEIFDASNAKEGATAENLFKGLMKTFDNNSVPLTNVIGFAADGCSSMMGVHNSVASRLKQACPGIYISKCVRHSAHLCASEACKCLPRAVEDLARNIYHFFKSSSKRQSEFIEFQEFVNVKPHKILHPSQTRWLSLIAVVKRILEQWNALRLFFTDRWLSLQLQRTEQIYKELNNPVTKLYYYFLEWILPKFTDFNKYFQSKRVVITELHDHIVALYKDILLSYLRTEYIMKTVLSEVNPCNKDQMLPLSQIYLGVRVTQNLNDLQLPEKEQFLQRCRNFLQTSAQQIKKRYDMEDPVLTQVGCLDKKNALSAKYRDSTSTLLNLMSVVPRIVSPNDNELKQLIDDQWRRLPFSKASLPAGCQEVTETDKFWSMFLEENVGDGFRELAIFALSVLSLPHSNADCERIFSQINLMKTKMRNKLMVNTVNGALLASECIKLKKESSTSFPTKDMLSSMTSSILYLATSAEDEDSDLKIF